MRETSKGQWETFEKDLDGEGDASCPGEGGNLGAYDQRPWIFKLS